MTNQQKYVELMAKSAILADRIMALHNENEELWEEMKAVATAFPETFYFRVDDQLLYRNYKDNTIEIRKFDK